MTEARNSIVRQSLHHAESLLFRGGPLLLVGESGTGKEYIAHDLHQRVFGSERELVRIDCSDPGVSTVIARGSAILLARFDLLSPEHQTELLQRAGEAGAAVIATSERESLPGFKEENCIRIPPLRERRADIEPLTCTFLIRHPPPSVAQSLHPAPPGALFKRYVRSAELLLIRWALRTCGDDRTKAARFLGLSRSALYKKLKLYPEFRVAES